MSQSQKTRAQAWILVEPARSGPTVFGLTGEERLRRTLAQLGVVDVQAGPEPSVPDDLDLLLLRADVVYDERLVTAAFDAPGTLLQASDGPLGPDIAVSAHLVAPGDAERAAAVQALRGETSAEAVPRVNGLRPVHPDDLVPPYDAKLRKPRPAWARSLRADTVRQVERQLFDASYKGITDFVTKWLWPRPALAVTRVLAAAGVSPNAVTLLSWALVAVATWAFAVGAFGPGLLAAWAMTFLDTVDGKLARVTLRSSRLGHVLDHGLDLLHPPVWYFFWAVGCTPQPDWFGVALWVVLGGYLAGRLVEGVFLAVLGMEIHCWRRTDAHFRLVTARRNPNLVLLSLGFLLGSPVAGFGAVAVWTAASVAFHVVRLAMALTERTRAGALRSFEDPQATPGRC